MDDEAYTGVDVKLSESQKRFDFILLLLLPKIPQIPSFARVASFKNVDLSKWAFGIVCLSLVGKVYRLKGWRLLPQDPKSQVWDLTSGNHREERGRVWNVLWKSRGC